MSITNASNISSGQLADRRLNTVLQDLSTMTYSTDSVVAYVGNNFEAVTLNSSSNNISSNFQNKGQ